LRISNIHKITYHTPGADKGESGSRESLKGLTFDVKEGNTVALVGSSGCGELKI